MTSKHFPTVVAGPLYGESTDDRWFPNIGPIMLNFDVSCIVNQNKLLRNSRIGRWYETLRLMRRHWLEVPQQINGPYPAPYFIGGGGYDMVLYQKYTLLTITT